MSDADLSPMPGTGSLPKLDCMLISARNLTMTYGTGSAVTAALADVALDIDPGSLTIMGPSGSGKTTLLHCLAGILRPTGGSVALRGKTLSQMSDRKRTALRRRDFGFVFQSGQLLAELPAGENAALPLMLDGMDSRSAVARANEWLQALGLTGLAGRRPGQLSGGQAQRVAIARALVGEPSVVFADEPTGALDQQTGHEVMQTLVQAVTSSGAALVVVTHEPGVAQACERTVSMRDGRIVAEYHASRSAAGNTTGMPTLDGPQPAGEPTQHVRVAQ